MDLEPSILKAVAWLHWKNDQMLCVRSIGKDKFYIPGGKYEQGESDSEALRREITEELGVTLIPNSIQELITIHAPAHGYPAPTKVAMKCFQADFEGKLAIASEIQELAWLKFEDRDECAPAARLAIEYLRDASYLATETG